MSDWKQKAKNLVANANLQEAIALCEDNGLDVGSLLKQVQELEAQIEKHLENKTQFSTTEYKAHNEKFSNICWDLLQKIDGTNDPMPDYLK